MSYSKTASQPGFTLVEMLVVAPIVILVVGGIVALLIALVGDVLIARERNSMAYNTQDVLNLIEQDVRLSSNIQATTGTLPSPQGSDSNVSGTAAFQSNSALILTLYATNLSPTDPNRLIITLNTPSACGSPNATANTPFTYTVVYFVYNNSLWRRVIVPDYNTNSSNTICNSPPWQKNSCQPGYSAARCSVADSKITENVSSITLSYYNGSSTTANSTATSGTTTATRVTINSSKTVAGQSISHSVVMRALRINN